MTENGYTLLAAAMVLGGTSFHNSVSHLEALKIERTSHILLLIKHTNPDYERFVDARQAFRTAFDGCLSQRQSAHASAAQGAAQ